MPRVDADAITLEDRLNKAAEIGRRRSFRARVSNRHRAEYLALRAFIGLLGSLPRRAARRVGEVIGNLAFRWLSRLRSVGLQNLKLAFPLLSIAEHERILRGEYRQAGHLLAEFCTMPSYNQRFVSRFIQYDGLKRYLQARDRGRGVLVLTGHLGAWELSSFFHSLMGYPMGMVIRRLDNPLIDAYVNRIRCLHGNRVLHKDDFARALLSEMAAGATVGILMDTNMTPPQGVFVPFFGVLACSAAGLARVARKTGAAVLPGFLLEEPEGRYRLHFGEEVEVTRTADAEADALTNTARFTRVLEQYIRASPEQWLWMHRRWKTRPPGEPRLYR